MLLIFFFSGSLEKRLRQIRCNLEDLAHDLLSAKKSEELQIYGIAAGHKDEKVVGKDTPNTGDTEETETETETIQQIHLEATSASAAETSVKHGHVAQAEANAQEKILASADDDKRSFEQGTQVQSEEVAEVIGTANEHQDQVENTAEQPLGCSEKSPLPQLHPDSTMALNYADQTMSGNHEKRNLKTLPDSLVQEIRERAFPLAEEGVSCAAFHALAAEALWAGFNGSCGVEKPPKSVWSPRGGDRWSTAAFFAYRVGEREEEASPGLPQMKMLRFDIDDEGRRKSYNSGGGHPIAGNSARHAAAHTVCMAALSSRRGFLHKAAKVAAEEVLHCYLLKLGDRDSSRRGIFW